LTPVHVTMLLAIGAGAGFASGLLGVGGGFIMVPLSYWIMLDMGVADELAYMTAIGTSLLVILPTAISGTWRHDRRKAVEWRTALVLGPCALVGALAGAALAVRLSGEVLRTGFGGLMLAVALWMSLGLMPRLAREDTRTRPGPWLVAACGLPIGVVTGMTGLGGGVLIVPILVLAFGFPMHVAIGTSVASIMFAGAGGIVGYVVNGWGLPELLPYSIGYVNLLPVGLCLVMTSVPMAQLGVRAAHALPARPLRYIFIGFMVYTGLRMIGLF
jgi:uncharacterized protein